MKQDLTLNQTESFKNSKSQSRPNQRFYPLAEIKPL